MCSGGAICREVRARLRPGATLWLAVVALTVGAGTAAGAASAPAPDRSDSAGSGPERRPVRAKRKHPRAGCAAAARRPVKTLRVGRVRGRACRRPRPGNGADAGGERREVLPVAVTAPTRDSQCTAADILPDAKNRAVVAAAVLCLVNVVRHQAGLAPLAAEGRLTAAARSHAEDMVSRHYFGHVSPTGRTGADRRAAAGYRHPDAPWAESENIAYATGSLSTARAAVDAWMASPHHRDNMLDPAHGESGLWTAPATPDGGPGATHVQYFASGVRGP